MEGRADPAAERALALLEETTAALEASRAEGARMAALLSRAVEAAEAASALAERRAAGLSAAADRAMALLDRTTGELEAARAGAAKAEGLLARAMQATERLEAENARLADALSEKDGVVESQARTVDRLFGLSETALDAAAKARRGGDAAPRGLIARVFGRRGGLS
jgi:hypothetical protein